MFNSQILDVLIGIVFIYCLVSIVCTALKEGIEGFLKTRAAYLEYGIREILHDTAGSGLSQAFFQHPFIYPLFPGPYRAGKPDKRPGLFTRGKNLPSYIPAHNFAEALLDLAAHGPDPDFAAVSSGSRVVDLNAIRANAVRLENPAVQRVLIAAIDKAQGNVDRAQKSLEAWYDSAMDRISGWYRRSTQIMILVISLVVTIGLNVNTLNVVNYLYVNDTARAVVVAKAQKAKGDSSDLSYAKTKDELRGLGLPIGWGQEWHSFIEDKSTGEIIYQSVVGWLLSALAATLGAPFWFDVLSKVMVVRSTLKPDEKNLGGIATNPQQPSEALGIAQQATLAQDYFNEMGDESHLDGCDGVHSGVETLDYELPRAQGGVA